MNLSLVTCKNIFALVAVVVLFAATASHAATRDPAEHFFHQSFGDFSEEKTMALEEGKQGVFIMFEDEDCPWCAKMKARVLNQVDVQDYYRKHFRILSVDINGDELITDFRGNEITQKTYAEKIRVRATPVLVIYDLDGNVAVRYTGAVRNTQEFMWLGEYFVDGHYQTTSFPQYKRSKKKLAESQK